MYCTCTCLFHRWALHWLCLFTHVRIACCYARVCCMLSCSCKCINTLYYATMRTPFMSLSQYLSMHTINTTATYYVLNIIKSNEKHYFQLQINASQWPSDLGLEGRDKYSMVKTSNTLQVTSHPNWVHLNLIIHVKSTKISQVDTCQ